MHMLLKMGESIDSYIVSVVHFNDCLRPLDPSLVRLSSISDLLSLPSFEHAHPEEP